MSTRQPAFPSILVLLLLFLSLFRQPDALQFNSYKTIISRSHLSRVALDREAPGDLDGVGRITDKLRSPAPSSPTSGRQELWAVGWDFALVSIPRSLLTRLALDLEARGDLAGARRTRWIAKKLRLVGGGHKELWADGLGFPLISLSRSILTRVALDREARGDLAGARRARWIADKLRLVGGGRKELLAIGWDFARNYAVTGGVSTADIYRAGTEVFDAVGEFVSLESDRDRARWVNEKYERVTELAKPQFRSLLKVFSNKGPLRDAILLLQEEVVEGELLKDCMKVGARDLDGLIRVAREMFAAANSGDGSSENHRLSLGASNSGDGREL